MIACNLAALAAALGGVVPQSTETWTSVHLEDVTGDGILDRIALSDAGHLAVFVQTAGRRFRRVDQELPFVAATAFLVDDLTGDGIPDVYVVADGDNLALRGLGGGHFEPATEELGLADSGPGVSVSRVDGDGDGRPDVLLRNRNGSVVFWSDPGGGYRRDAGDSTAAPGPVASSVASGVALASTATVPAGTILAFAGVAPPAGYLFCDGSEVSRTLFPDLFRACGVTYGAGNLVTTFNLPDLRQRLPLGRADSGTGTVLGETGGAIDHTHAAAAHTHLVPGHGHGFALSAGSDGQHAHTVSGSTDTGGDHTHSVSGSTNTTGSHSHNITGRSNGAQFGTFDIFPRSVQPGNQSNTPTTSSGSHSHSVSGTANSAGSHAHAVTGTTDLTGDHTHPVTGSVGNAAVDGDARFATDGGTGGTTGSGNPPYIALNYIIKT